jgi:hypothetical protein
MNSVRSYCFAITVLLLSVTGAAAQLPPPTVVPPVPNLNPSSSLVHYSSVCSVFRHKPCFPYYLPPIGQYLRLTIVSTDEDALRTENRVVNAADDHTLNTIRDMFAALRACWVPPPKDEAHHGMEYTILFAFKRDGTMIAAPRMTYSSHDVPSTTRDVYRVAIDAALKRCTRLHFTDGMGGAEAGRPIAIRFVDDRTIDQQHVPR